MAAASPADESGGGLLTVAELVEQADDVGEVVVGE